MVVCYDERTLASEHSAADSGAWPLVSHGSYMLAMQLGVLRAGAAFLLAPAWSEDNAEQSGLEKVVLEVVRVKARCVVVLDKDVSAIEELMGVCAPDRGDLPAGFRVLSAQAVLSDRSSCVDTTPKPAEPFHPCWFVTGSRIQACEHRNAAALLDSRLRHPHLSRLYRCDGLRTLCFFMGATGSKGTSLAVLFEHQTVDMLACLAAGGVLIFPDAVSAAGTPSLQLEGQVCLQLLCATRARMLATPAACFRECFEQLISDSLAEHGLKLAGARGRFLRAVCIYLETGDARGDTDVRDDGVAEADMHAWVQQAARLSNPLLVQVISGLISSGYACSTVVPPLQMAATAVKDADSETCRHELRLAVPAGGSTRAGRIVEKTSVVGGELGREGRASVRVVVQAPRGSVAGAGMWEGGGEGELLVRVSVSRGAEDLDASHTFCHAYRHAVPRIEYGDRLRVTVQPARSVLRARKMELSAGLPPDSWACVDVRVAAMGGLPLGAVAEGRGGVGHGGGGGDVGGGGGLFSSVACTENDVLDGREMKVTLRGEEGDTWAAHAALVSAPRVLQVLPAAGGGGRGAWQAMVGGDVFSVAVRAGQREVTCLYVVVSGAWLGGSVQVAAGGMGLEQRQGE